MSRLGASPLSTFRSLRLLLSALWCADLQRIISHRGKMTVMKNTRQERSRFTNTKPTKLIVLASAVKDVLAYDTGDSCCVFPCSSAFHLHLWSFCVWFPTSEALLWVLNRAQGLPWQPESLWQLEQLYCKDRGYGEKGSVPSHLLLLRLAKSLLPRDVAQGWGPRLHH